VVTLQKARPLGAIAILAVGAVHLEQYLGSGYRSIPTIGPLFLLNALSSGVVAIGLLTPIGRVLEDRGAQLASGLLAAAAVAIAAGSLIALFISENGKLFGFSESGYSTAIVIAIVAEAVTIVLLAPVAVLSLRRAASVAGATRSAAPLGSR
jgi:hypothetical protein